MMAPSAHLTRRTFLAASLVALAGCGSAPAPTQTPPPAPTTAPVVAPTAAPPPAPPATATSAAPPTAASAPTAAPAAVATKPAAASKLGESGVPAKPTARTSGNIPPELQQTAKAMSGLKSYTMTGTVASKERGKMEMVADFVAPDRRRMEIKGATPDQSMGFMTIGPDTYMKMGPTWQKMPAGQGGASRMDFFDTSWLDHADGSGTTMTPAGSEAVNGEPCTVYAFTDPDGKKGKMWVSTRDSTMRKFEVVDDDGTEVNMLVSNINQPIKIDPPV